MEYRVNFFNTCLEELYDSNNETLKANSLSHRLSKLDVNEYNTFMKSGDDIPKKIEVDHEAQMKRSQGLR